MTPDQLTINLLLEQLRELGYVNSNVRRDHHDLLVETLAHCRRLNRMSEMRGGAQPLDLQARCTCVTMWNAVTPPPYCPVHGQAEMLEVTCTPGYT